jgi:hypothetical protein
MWFKVDDTFYDHPKAVGMSNDSLATWTRAGDWCSRQLTDGVFAREQLPGFAGDADDPDAVLRDLVLRRLWEPGPEAEQVRFHDWAQWQPTRAQVLDKRKKDRERRAAWLASRRDRTTGQAAAGNGVSNTVTDSHAVSNTVSGADHDVIPGVIGVDHGVSSASDHTSPTRPEGGSVGTNTGANPTSLRNAQNAVTDDDDRTALEHQVVAFMVGAGHRINRAQAAALIDVALAGHTPREPGPYVIAILRKDPAGWVRKVTSSRQPPPVASVLPNAHRPGGPASDAQRAARAAEARAGMAAATAPAPAPAAIAAATAPATAAQEAPDDVLDLPDW